jgi:hypothetical protein
VPTALCCSETFAPLARMEATAKGYPTLPLVVVPHPFGTMPAAVVRGYAVNALPDVIDVLTTPLERLAGRGRDGA